MVIAPKSKAIPQAALRAVLSKALLRPLTGQIDEVLLDPNAGALQRQRAELEAAAKAEPPAHADDDVARLIAVVAGTGPDAVTLDPNRQRAIVSAAVLPGATLATYQALELRARAALPEWDVRLIPPAMALPTIRFSEGSATLDDADKAAVSLSIWAAKRWNYAKLAIPGLVQDTSGRRPRLSQRRAAAIAEIVQQGGIGLTPAPASGGAFPLAAP